MNRFLRSGSLVTVIGILLAGSPTTANAIESSHLIAWTLSGFREGVFANRGADLDGDGMDDAVLTARTWGNSSYMLIVAGFNPVSGNPEIKQKMLFPPDPSFQGQPLIAVQAGAFPKVVAVMGQTVHVFAGWPLIETSRFDLLALHVDAVQIADINGDGNAEIVTSTSTHYYPSATAAYSLSGEQLWDDTASPGSLIAFGQLDGDMQQEVLVGGGYGSTGFVLDGLTGAQEWSFAGGFHVAVAAGNLDTDSLPEFVSASGSGQSLVIFQTEPYSPVSEILAPNPIGSFALTDLDNDGTNEIIYYDDFFNIFHIFDIIQNADIGHFQPDLDPIWSSMTGRFRSDHRPTLIVHGSDEFYDRWALKFYTLPNGMMVNSIDTTAGDDVVHAAGVSSVGTPLITMATNTKLRLIQEGNVTPILTWSSPSADELDRLSIVDMPNLQFDEQSEIAAVTQKDFSQILDVVNSRTGAVIFSFDSQLAQSPTYKLKIQRMTHLDYNQDGLDDLVLAAQDTDGDYSIRLYLIDGLTHALVWTSTPMGSNAYDLAAFDTDNDSAKEIVIVSDGVYAFDPVSHLLEWSLPGDIRDCDLVIDADGSRHIALLYEDGTVEIRHADDRMLEKSVTLDSRSRRIWVRDTASLDIWFLSTGYLRHVTGADAEQAGEPRFVGSQGIGYGPLFSDILPLDTPEGTVLAIAAKPGEFQIEPLIFVDAIFSSGFEAQ